MVILVMSTGLQRTLSMNSTPIKSRLQIELLRSVAKRRSGSMVAKGFTLVELMIVVAVVGILSAVSLPRYLAARAAAGAGAVIGEKIGLAKECATYAASGGVGVAPAVGTNLSLCTAVTSGGVANYTGSWATYGSTPVSGLKCLDQTGSGFTVNIQVSSTGGLTCTIS